jgi:hypothetical protein
MIMRISRTGFLVAAVLALIVLLMAVQFGPAVFGGTSSNTISRRSTASASTT